MENFVVTFARGFGSGGKEIASNLAKELGIHCYENRILTLASQMSGLDEKLFQEVNEKVRTSGGFSNFMKGLPRSKSYITRNEKFERKGVTVLHSIEETLEFLKQFPSEDVFIIGGEEIYRQFLPCCDTAHVTWIDYKYQADTHFPVNLDQDPNWHVTAESDEQTYFDLCYEFRKYERK